MTSLPRRAREPERQIPDFDVFELDGGRWQAVHVSDHDLTLEHSDWCELFMACVAARVRYDLQRAAEELAERMAAHPWRNADV
ncbi:hypothetical protein BJF79_23620 [Actinomadura sp. CNU-125]|uniref:hypothetical protein n=1 Tax=Actinomadura sp. CNU-125 TaxID=1904961 RepID=UPI0009690DF9|nr:hypothetical protein [Actinomadura sp. CNU-125]OLT11714.1 hypothetical protein BJF79_23620 [Actinomadura sp. CNU-125]